MFQKKVKQGSYGLGSAGHNGGGIAILNRVVQEDLIEKVRYEQRPE